MSEQIRQHYLKQMGVTVWYSRCELPGAAESPEFLFGANLAHAEEGSSHVQENQKREKLETGTPKSAADILNALSSKQSPTNTSEGLPHSANKSTGNAQSAETEVGGAGAFDSNGDNLNSAADVVVRSSTSGPSSSVTGEHLASRETRLLGAIEHLDLMLWVGEKNWFVSDNDSEYPEQLKQQLMLNIASAMGESVEKTQVTYFRWPFFGNQRLPGNSPDSMLAIFRDWLGELLLSDDLTGFLMGGTVTGLLLQQSPPQCIGDTSVIHISDEREVKVVTTLPLNDMLREPMNKRIVWQHLSTFKLK